MTGELSLFTIGGDWRWSIWVLGTGYTIEAKSETNRHRNRADAKAAAERAAKELGIELVPQFKNA